MSRPDGGGVGPTLLAISSSRSDCIMAGVSDQAGPAEADKSTERLENLAKAILRHQAEACANWLEGGRLLIEAKKALPHGKFGAWCRSRLSYSESKATKQMQAAECFGPLLKTATVTDLPSPAPIYLLAAPSCPQTIFDEFAPRVIAGEQVCPEIRAALKRHRNEARHARLSSERADQKTSTTQAIDAQAEMPRVQPPGRFQADEEHSVSPENAKAPDARSRALVILLERLGAALPALMEHVAQAGPGCIFSVDVERDLQSRAAGLLPVEASHDGGSDEAVKASPSVVPKDSAASEDCDTCSTISIPHSAARELADVSGSIPEPNASISRRPATKAIVHGRMPSTYDSAVRRSGSGL